MVAKNLVAPALALLVAMGQCAVLIGQEADQLPANFLANTTPTLHSNAKIGKALSLARSKTQTTQTANPAVTRQAGLPGIDSIVNFTGQFNTPGYDPAGNPNRHWQYNMVGNSPDRGGTTSISAPVIPVSLDLRNADGSVRFVNGKRLFSDATQFVRPVLNSPLFQNSRFSSSERPTQYNDAVQRAEFGDRAEDNWHTLLSPHVKRGRVMKLLAGSYQFALNSDGSCCAFVLIDSDTFVNELFPPTYPVDNTTVIGAAELAGDMTTKDLTTFLFPNAYLYDNGDPNDCCVLGFHSIDVEPGVPANGNLDRFYVMAYASWISPGLFGGGFQDVTALSHELAETFNDPFVAFDNVHNITPWWNSNGLCQDNLEVGDVIEVLPNATYPMLRNGYTYHPQNEALLPWFEFRSPSNAIHGAYSYPDETVLTALSPIEKADCM